MPMMTENQFFYYAHYPAPLGADIFDLYFELYLKPLMQKKTMAMMEQN